MKERDKKREETVEKVKIKRNRGVWGREGISRDKVWIKEKKGRKYR